MKRMNPAGGVGPALRKSAQPELLTQETRSATRNRIYI